MFDTAFWILVGAFVGWHVPQPFWAKVLQEKVLDIIRSKVPENKE